MSKITYIGGDLIEEIGGSYKVYAKEGYEINSLKQVIFNGKDGVLYKEPQTPPEIEDNSTVFYETDGHYSTVYLVCLMLGMNEHDAEELAIATEAPDTTIHNEMDFELNDTWGYPQYQKKLHSLTGGFHGVEEMITALKFLHYNKEYSKNDTKEEIHEKTIKKLGELLHRFGDTYAHTKLDNLKPKDLKEYALDDDEKNKANIEIAINSWKGKGGRELANDVEPWVRFINYYINKHGYKFLENIDYQKEALNGRTLEKYLHEIYFTDGISNFEMYGGGFYTTQHLTADGSYPDKIYLRPDWYLSYVKNLAWILSIRFNLDLSKLDISVFERMVKFATKNKCPLKGIIDFEIARQRHKRVFYIPIYYSSPNRIVASGDEFFVGNYISDAEKAKNRTIEYMLETYNFPIIEEVNSLKRLKFTLQTSSFIDTKLAYKLTY